MKLQPLFFVLFVLTAAQPVLADDIQGAATGWWSDSSGNNYQCPPNCPGGGSSSSGGYDSSAYYSAAYAQAAAQAGQVIGQMFAQGMAEFAAAQARAAQAYSFNLAGNKALNSGQYEQAIFEYEQALQITPNNQIYINNLNKARALSWNAKGREFHKQGDWQNAMAAYKKALEYEPSNRVIHQNIRLATQQKNYAEIRQREFDMQADMISTAGKLHSAAQTLSGDLKPGTDPVRAAAALKPISESAYGPGRGLHIRGDIPLPGSGPPLPPEVNQPNIDLNPYEQKAEALWNAASEKFHDGKAWLGGKIEETGVEETWDIAKQYVPGAGAASKLKDYYDQTKALYQKVGTAHVETAQDVLNQVHSGVEEVASPYQRSTGVENEAWLNSRAEGYKGMANEAYRSKFKGKSESMLKGFHEEWKDFGKQEPETAEPTGTTPILGLKSYDRQRQEALNAAAKQQ